MLLKRVKLKNIRSYIDEEIEFPTGSVLLAGDIGTGKSTVLLALDFALFGIRRGELTGTDLLRHGKSSGFVEVEFEIGKKNVIVRRTLRRKNNGVSQDSGYIIIDGVKEELSPTELKSRILELFGYPPELLTKAKSVIFRYTVYTPQEQMKHILFSNPEERLNTLRKIFDIDKYKTIQNNARIVLTELRATKRAYAKEIENLPDKEKELDEKEKEKVSIEKGLAEVSMHILEIEKVLDEKKKTLTEFEDKIKELRKLEQSLAKTKTGLELKERRAKQIENDLKDNEKKMSALRKTLENYKDLKKPEEPQDTEKLEKELRALLSKKSLIANEIEKLQKIYDKGVCEFCGQDVHDPKSFRARIEERQKELEENQKKIKNLEMELKAIKGEREEYKKKIVLWERKNNIEQNIKDLEKSHDKMEEEFATMKKEIEEMKKELSALEKKIKQYENVEKDYEKRKEEFDEIKEKQIAVEKDKARLEQRKKDLDEVIKNLEKEIKEKRAMKKKIAQLDKIITWLDSFFGPLMSTIEKYVMASIQQSFNSFFQEWFSIIIDDMSVRVDESFTPIIEQNGYETEYQNLSGGEKTAVALAYRLALNKVINSMIERIKTKDLLILDEPTDGFSTDQLDKMRDVLNKLDLRQIIIVSHEPKIDTFVDNVIRFYKEQHVSRVEK
ncbi:MAG: AAA family ATPase [Candidatus Aenigmarchaeota archaeon]|nr:AAA family ATPase [Candidatus Aenigmarchaeota archaeon]